MATPAALAALYAASAAIKGVVEEIRRLPDAVRGFVQAFNPVAVERLDQAYGNLAATLGRAFEPVINTAASTVQQFADAISGAMHDLRDPIADLAGLFSGVVKSLTEGAAIGLESLARALDKLKPLNELLGTALQGVAGIGTILSAVFGETLVGLIEQLVPSAKSLTDVTNVVTAAFAKLAETTLRLSDFILTTVGLSRLMKPILESLIKERDVGSDRKAPGGFTLGGIEDVYRRRILESARGVAPDTGKQTVDLLADLKRIAAAMLEELKNRPEQRAAARQQAAENAVGAFSNVPALRLFQRWFELQFGVNNPNLPPGM